MLKYSIELKTFIFKTPSGTSRGVLTEKQAFFVRLWDPKFKEIVGLGECSFIPGLSPDFKDLETYEKNLRFFLDFFVVHFNLEDFSQKDLSELQNIPNLIHFPSILFGLETALLDLVNGGKAHFFDTDFSSGKSQIPINGLIWMGSEEFMQAQIDEKIKQGFSCIKMKIGAIDFENEIEILAKIRQQFSKDKLILRVDANGAFSFEEALEKMERLAKLDIHSIEQPIKAGSWLQMKDLCQQTSLPIALDEELIGIYQKEEKIKLLETIQPQYIILKPSLHGGFSGCSEWISLAEEQDIPWWMTSALESNVGLNAIAQFTATFNNNLHQGLGTGSLYVENTKTDLAIENGFLKLVN